MYGIQYLFFVRNRIEKGQAVKLCFGREDDDDTGEKHASDVVQGARARTIIGRLIMQLSIRDLKALVSDIVTRKSAISQIDGESDVTRQIFHVRLRWLAEKIQEHVTSVENEIEGPIGGVLSDIARIRQTVASLSLQDNVVPKGLPTPENTAAVMKEAAGNLVGSLILRSHWGVPYESSTYCSTSVKGLLTYALQLFAQYRMNNPTESLIEQEALVKALLVRVETFVLEFFRSYKEQKRYGWFGKAKAVGFDCSDVKFLPTGVFNMRWYVQTQILDPIHALSGVVSWLSAPKPVFSISSVIDVIVKAAFDVYEEIQNKKAVTVLGDFYANHKLRTDPPSMRIRPQGYVRQPKFECQREQPSPAALPLFLGLIWPKLQRKYGWRVEAGQTDADIAFFPPGQGKRNRRLHDKSAKVRQERVQKRARIDRRLHEIGLGYIQKMTKRLAIKCSDDDQVVYKGKVPVKEVLKLFVESVQPEGSPDEERWRKQSIADSICKCFDEILPLVSNCETSVPSDTVGMEKLIQILLVLPNVLQQSGLPFRQIEDTIATLKELIRFITVRFTEFLDEQYHPHLEEYATEEGVGDSFLSSRLQKLAKKAKDAPPTPEGKASQPQPNAAGVEDDNNLIRELILPEDVPDLTDFTVMAMRQFVPCRSTAKDVGRKGRRTIPVGYPGMVCKNCWGVHGEGKYFFSSLDSLGTAAGVVYSHLIKCPNMTVENRKKLTSYKARHSDDRKNLKFGSQAAYFGRLWKRLHSATTVGNAGIYVVQNDTDAHKSEADQTETTRSANLQSFKSHTEVLELLQTSRTWLEHGDLQDALSKYHKVLEYGGKVVGTSAATPSFNSEWLLAKLLPSDALHRKKSSVGI